MIRSSEKHSCEYAGCEEDVDEPGLLCRRHWRCVPRVLRDQYKYTRGMILNAVKASEEVR